MTVVVTDIEGTTSAIAFVRDVLFPYARRRLPDFVRAGADRPDIAALLDETRALAGAHELDTEGVIQVLVGWIDEDRKAAPLKELQGMLWAEGYAAGDYRAHVYPDAAAALRRWRAMGIALYVFSSGSVAAQRLLFAHSEAGDLTPVFSGYFDTRIGPKREAASYVAIARQVLPQGGELLFLSDSVDELDAAAAAGLGTVLVCRGARPPPARHRVVESFDQIDGFLGEDSAPVAPLGG
ncbi:MAG TPA: acireductone synthase [Kofleriaceae bacterium]|nr:acireductone synthase [Kofleriaceae bacterium]